MAKQNSAYYNHQISSVCVFLYNFVPDKVFNEHDSYVAHTLGHGDDDPRDYDLLAITTLNLCSKYSPLTAMLVYPVIMIFCFDFLTIVTWKWAKLVDFSLPILKLVAILSMWYLWYLPQYHKYYLLFRIHHHIFVERCLRNHYIKFGGELTPQKPKKMAIFYTLQVSY